MNKGIHIAKRRYSRRQNKNTKTASKFEKRIWKSSRLVSVLKKHWLPVSIVLVICVITTTLILSQIGGNQGNSPSIQDIWVSNETVLVRGATLDCTDEQCELIFRVRNNSNSTVNITAVAIYYYDENWNLRQSPVILNITLEPGEEKTVSCVFTDLNINMILDPRTKTSKVQYGILATTIGRVKFKIEIPI